MKIMLDTNAYTFLRSGDKAILREITKSSIVYLSVITIGELYAGFRRGNRLEKNSKDLEDFLQKPPIELVNVTYETATIFGELRYTLLKKGTPIPIADLWIAANAIETGSMLITYDRDFLQVSGLRVWDRLKKKQN